MNAFIFRYRIKLARWLIRPMARSIIKSYDQAARYQHSCGRHVEAEHCEYIAIGASYVADGVWRGDNNPK